MSSSSDDANKKSEEKELLKANNTDNLPPKNICDKILTTKSGIDLLVEMTTKKKEQELIKIEQLLKPTTDSSPEMVYESFFIEKNSFPWPLKEVRISICKLLAEYKYENLLLISKEEFEENTKGYKLIPYSNLNEFDSKSSFNKVMIIGVLDLNLAAYSFTKANTTTKLFQNDNKDSDGNNDDEQDDENDENYHEKSNSNNKRKRNVILSNSKKQKVLTVTKELLYSDNLLKDILFDYSVSGRKATIVRNDDKVALYCKLDGGFLKIVHYFNKTFENMKGMEIINSIQHDNINKIFQYKKQSITTSQLNELFFENIPFTKEDPTIFVTFSQLVGDVDDFLIYMNQMGKDLDTRLLCFSKIMLDAIDAVNTLHENNIIHGDITIRNVGVSFTKNQMTNHVEESFIYQKSNDKSC